jgi:hypothetical protein
LPAQVTIQWAVPPGYRLGDYARLHSNGGAGDIDWDDPVDAAQYELFPHGGGLFGWGHAPWGHFPWAHAWSSRCRGWGHLPWGHFPWGHGTTLIQTQTTVITCGNYRFGLKTYDAAGNAHAGTPDEVEMAIHITPAQPAGLKFSSYNKDTDILVLEVI